MARRCSLCAQRRFRALALALLERERDHVCDGDTEQAILGGPRHRRSDLLVTQHALQPAMQMHRDVEHRGDIQRRKVVAGEFTRARVGVRVVRDDRFASGERLEVRGIESSFELRPRGVLVAAQLIQIDAAQGGTALAVAPERNTLDLHQARRGLGDQLQSLLQILPVEHIAARQSDQSGLLLEQALASDAKRGKSSACLHVASPRVPA